MKRRNNVFAETPVARPKRNLFDLSHEVKMTAKFGYLYPVLVQETLPGDVFRNTSTIMMRFAPMLAPIMHKVNVTTHFFFVPYRLCTDHWEDFITGGMSGEVAPILPYITPQGIVDAAGYPRMQKYNLWDYLGLPVAPSVEPAEMSNEQISVLPFRAYQKIFNDYYRDPNFTPDIDLDLELQGNVSAVSVAKLILDIRARGWNKDYFTSALAQPQRGPEVLMPIEGIGDVTYKPVSEYYNEDGSPPTIGDAIFTAGVAGNLYSDTDGATDPTRVENIDDVTFANTSITINDFRVAVATQRWLENNARGGYRYVDQILSHYAVHVNDYRLQRAEYLGGGKQPVRISEVLSTIADGGSLGAEPLGTMGGHGLSVGKSNRFTYMCREHGIILGIMSVTPDSAYQQGLDKMWTRTSKFDFAWPEFAHLGEQAIKSKELYFSFGGVTDPDEDNNETFGYTPRYAEYKFKNDRVSGDFRDTLRFWHLGRVFTSRPVLDATFTTVLEAAGNGSETLRRIFAVQDGTDYLWIDIFHRFTAKRPLPYFGVPKLIG